MKGVGVESSAPEKKWNDLQRTRLKMANVRFCYQAVTLSDPGLERVILA